MSKRLGLKDALKHILPPPIKSFMREVDNIHDSVWRSKGELSGQISEAVKASCAQYDDLNEQLGLLEKRAELLSRYFEAANDENKRLYFLLIEQQNQHDSQIAELISLLDKEISQRAAILAQFEAVSESNKLFGERLDKMQCSIQGDIAGVRGSISRVMRRQDEMLDPALYPHALTMWYQNATGETLNLEHPRTYNEKIQWLKLHDSTELKSRLSDKVKVRDWVADRIGPEYLIKQYGVFRTAAEIDFSLLPNSFVLKANHGSGWNAIVRDKRSEDLSALRAKADLWLKANFAFSNGFELQYSQIARRLLVEELLETPDGDLPDYKMWCFSGKVQYIEFISGRGSCPTAAFFTRDWVKTNFCTEYPLNKADVPKPSNLAEMIWVAETLAETFPHVRVDLYHLNDGTIKFGEMTFSTSSGAIRWNPPETDLMMGELLELPLELVSND